MAKRPKARNARRPTTLAETLRLAALRREKLGMSEPREDPHVRQVLLQANRNSLTAAQIRIRKGKFE